MVVKSMKQASQDQQYLNQQQPLQQLDQILNDQDQFHAQHLQRQTKGLRRSISEVHSEARNNFSLKVTLCFLILLLFIYFGGQFIVELVTKVKKQQSYKDNMKVIDEFQRKNSMSISVQGYQSKQFNISQSQQNQNHQDSNKQQGDHQMDVQLRFHRDQSKNPLSIKNNSEGKTSRQNMEVDTELKMSTYKEMYDQFVKSQQIANTNQQSNDEPNQSSINPVVYPFNQDFPIEQLYSQYGSFAGVSAQTITKANKWSELTNHNIYTDDNLSISQKSYYQQRYQISKYQQLPFCIVVPTYNNAMNYRYLHNIQSIIMQNYKNYHVVIIDDSSTDNTSQLIEHHLHQQHKIQKSQYVLIKNKERLNAMPNLRNAAQNYCKPQEIFMIVDGDDKLIGRQVLKLYNAVFQQKKLWFVYSNFLLSRRKIGYSRPFPKSTIRKHTFRRYPFITSHLRAFYTKLFLNIRQEDLKDKEGNYFKASNDVAICLPILEQAQERIGYLPEVTYSYNSDTGLNNHQIRLREQRVNERQIRMKAPYQRLQNLMD